MHHSHIDIDIIYCQLSTVNCKSRRELCISLVRVAYYWIEVFDEESKKNEVEPTYLLHIIYAPNTTNTA